MVVAGGAPGGERIVEPEPVFGGDGIGGVGKPGGSLVGGNYGIRVLGVVGPDTLRSPDDAIDEVVGEIEETADKGLVPCLDLVGRWPTRVGEAPHHKPAFCPRGHDDHVLGHLRLHQTEYFRAVVLSACRPPNPSPCYPPAPQVDTADVPGEDEDLEQGMRLGYVWNRLRQELERKRSGIDEGIGAQCCVDEPEKTTQDRILVERFDVVELVDDAQPQLGFCRLIPVWPEARFEEPDQIVCDVGIGGQRLGDVCAGERRCHDGPVRAIGAQNIDLVVIEPGEDDQLVQRIRFRNAADGGGQGLRHPRSASIRVESHPVRAKDTEVVQEQILTVVFDSRRHFFDDPKPEILEQGKQLR